MKLSAGEVIEVRSENEILATLDENSTFEGLPFIPDMRKYCERRFRVLRRINRIMVEGVGSGRIENTVILAGVTCDSESNGGCRRTCPLLWKEAWLKRVDNGGEGNRGNRANRVAPFASESGVKILLGAPTCQSVNLLKATSPIRKGDLRQYTRDISSGTYSPLELIHTITTSLSLRIQKLLIGERPSAFSGRLRRTPSVSLNLRPGEIVQVRNLDEILGTLDVKGKNRGLSFTPEMAKYCGKRFRVLKRLDRMVNERTGEMRKIANTVLLKGSTCDGKAHRGCQRTCYCLWREIWLKRVNGLTDYANVKSTDLTESHGQEKKESCG